MVAHRLRALAAGAAAIVAALCATAAFAEAQLGVKLRILESLTREAPEDWALSTLGSARVSASATSDTVKAELAVDALLSADIVASLARASVTARFPRFRLTLGKARLSWGQGAAFNAGDLIFGGSSAMGLDLTVDTLRDDAAWLVSAYVPLGSWNFAEAVLLPPPVSIAALLQSPASPLPDPGELAAGGRVQGKLGGLAIEAAYLYRGVGEVHNAALTLQGNLFVDLNASVSTSFPSVHPSADAVLDGLRFTAGLAHLQRIGRLASLSLRLEVLLEPRGEWVEVEPPFAPGTGARYGLLLYPEIALLLDQVVSITARALVSPIEASALIVPGVSVSLQKGLTFLALASLSVGDDTDSYSWRRRGGLGFLAGCSFTY